MKRFRSLFALLALAVGMSVGACASITEIRSDFFEQTSNLPATGIATPGLDASYAIGAYESTQSAAILPTLRWTDENGKARSVTGTMVKGTPGYSVSLFAIMRVKASTVPTIETNGDDTGYTYSLYVSGLGFWPEGSEGQGGLSEVTGAWPRYGVYSGLAFAPSSSTSALLVAYSTGYAGADVPYVTWTDEYSTHSVSVPVGSPITIPIRAAGGTKVWVTSYPGDATWYGLVVMGIPTSGSGPFQDYELDMPNWKNASYPNWETVFTNGSTAVTTLVVTNFDQQPNNGSVEEALDVTGYTITSEGFPCPDGLLADEAGDPAGCALPFIIPANGALQVRTANQTGSPWGISPAYNVEMDVLQF